MTECGKAPESRGATRSPSLRDTPSEAPVEETRVSARAGEAQVEHQSRVEAALRLGVGQGGQCRERGQQLSNSHPDSIDEVSPKLP